MANRNNRVPKKGDRVATARKDSPFVVVTVHNRLKTVDLQSLKAHKDVGPVEKGVPWTMLIFLDEEDASQAAARVVRESTS